MPIIYMTEAITGALRPVPIDQISSMDSAYADAEDYGLHMVPLEDDDHEFIEFAGFESDGENLTEIVFENGETISVLHSINEIEDAIEDNIKSLHMNAGLRDRLVDAVGKFSSQVNGQFHVIQKFGSTASIPLSQEVVLSTVPMDEETICKNIRMGLALDGSVPEDFLLTLTRPLEPSLNFETPSPSGASR